MSFDPVALREKYRQERDKRLRSDGIRQYRSLAGGQSESLVDPFAEPGFRRSRTCSSQSCRC